MAGVNLKRIPKVSHPSPYPPNRHLSLSALTVGWLGPRPPRLACLAHSAPTGLAQPR